MMETTNTRFFKSPSPEVYRKNFQQNVAKPLNSEKMPGGLACVAHAAHGTAGHADVATSAGMRPMRSIEESLKKAQHVRGGTAEAQLTPFEEKERIERQKRNAKYKQMQQDRLKSHYGGMFNSRDRS